MASYVDFDCYCWLRRPILLGITNLINKSQDNLVYKVSHRFLEKNKLFGRTTYFYRLPTVCVNLSYCQAVIMGEGGVQALIRDRT